MRWYRGHQCGQRNWNVLRASKEVWMPFSPMGGELVLPSIWCVQGMGPLQGKDGEKALVYFSSAWPEGMRRPSTSDLRLWPLVTRFSLELPCSVSPGLAGDMPCVAAAVGGSRSLTKPIFFRAARGEEM